MVPNAIATVRGPNLELRLVTPEDAGFIHGLRTDPVYNRHLSEVRGTVEDQRRWIEDYKAREAEMRELYYVIARRDGVRCGVVRLYGIGPESFTWGSWILDRNKTRKAALESAVLSFSVGFDWFGLSIAHVDVRIGNEHAEAFYRRLGMTETHRTDRDVYFVYPRHRHEADRAGHMAVLEAL